MAFPDIGSHCVLIIIEYTAYTSIIYDCAPRNIQGSNKWDQTLRSSSNLDIVTILLEDVSSTEGFSSISLLVTCDPFSERWTQCPQPNL